MLIVSASALADRKSSRRVLHHSSLLFLGVSCISRARPALGGAAADHNESLTRCGAFFVWGGQEARKAAGNTPPKFKPHQPFDLGTRRLNRNHLLTCRVYWLHAQSDQPDAANGRDDAKNGDSFPE